MYVKLNGHVVLNTNVHPQPIVFKCPNCGNGGSFVPLHQVTDYVNNPENKSFGLRRCPNPNCNAVLFYVREHQNYVTFPTSRIDFNSENIPTAIVENLTEAITCHSNKCFIAAGMMIRKTLEAVCEDKGTTGANLHQKLQNLKSKVLMPNELFDALNILKLLGNDAAHIEAKTFEEIGQTEIEISIEFTKEILKAVYQYKGLLDKLNSLKKPQNP